MAAFPTAELSAFARHITNGQYAYHALRGEDGVSVLVTIDAWLEVPEAERSVMAALVYHGARFCDPALLGASQVRSGVDLTWKGLRRVASELTELPPATVEAFLELLPGATVTVEDLVSAIAATAA